MWSSWSAWVEISCSESCCTGVANRTRTRTCTNPPPTGSGADCDGEDTEVWEGGDCNTQICPGKISLPVFFFFFFFFFFLILLYLLFYSLNHLASTYFLKEKKKKKKKKTHKKKKKKITRKFYSLYIFFNCLPFCAFIITFFF